MHPLKCSSKLNFILFVQCFNVHIWVITHVMRMNINTSLVLNIFLPFHTLLTKWSSPCGIQIHLFLYKKQLQMILYLITWSFYLFVESNSTPWNTLLFGPEKVTTIKSSSACCTWHKISEFIDIFEIFFLFAIFCDTKRLPSWWGCTAAPGWLPAPSTTP